MITYHTGDILKSGANVICHQVNCKGVVGAGLAKQIRNTYPNVYNVYKAWCESGHIELGNVLSVEISNIEQPTFIVNMFAQDGYGRDKRYTDYGALRECFNKVKKYFRIFDTIAIPDHVGCGLAGGNWNVVKRIIEEVFADFEGEVQICRLP